MKRAAAATAITLSVIGGAAIVGRLDRTVPATTTAPITTHKQPATGVQAIPPPPIKEAEKDCAACKSTNSLIVSAPSIPVTSYRATAPSGAATAGTRSINGKASVRAAARVSTSPATASASPSATNDPYHDSMLPGGSKWENVTVSALKENNPNPDVGVANATTPSTTSAKSVPNARRVFTPTKTTPGALNTPSPTPPVPDWTRCSTSWSQTLSLGKNGEQIWTFSTTLSDADVQDLATSVRWYADIAAKYPVVARNYAWLDCAGWRVRDYHQHGSNTPPANFYGAQGLDSPLGTCHSTTPFRRTRGGRCSAQSDALGCSGPGATSTISGLRGTIGDDGKERGWVRYHSDWYVGVVEDATCTDSCVAGFDHPCGIETERENPGQGRDVNGVAFFTWWWGGDVNGEPPW